MEIVYMVYCIDNNKYWAQNYATFAGVELATQYVTYEEAEQALIRLLEFYKMVYEYFQIKKIFVREK